MSEFAVDLLQGLLMAIGLKSLIFGQYWPWQYRNGCPHCRGEQMQEKRCR